MVPVTKKFYYYFYIVILLLFYAFFGLRWQLETLITKNYTLRTMGFEPDKLYWADDLYMRLYANHTNFYSEEAKRILSMPVLKSQSFSGQTINSAGTAGVDGDETKRAPK